MKKNIGRIDVIIRIIIAVVLVALYFTEVVTGTLGIILLVVAAIAVLTSFMSRCPLYAVLGLNSCPRKK